MSLKVFLFDLDGVFVQPGGYREAVRASIRHFLEGWKLPMPEVPDDVMEYLESIGVTNEWDMVPIIISIIVDAYLRDYPHYQDQFFRFEKYPEFGRLTIENSLYLKVIKKIEKVLKSGLAPSDAILNAGNNGEGKEIFPYLSAFPMFNTLFSHTRQVAQSSTTRVFQHFVLGSEEFSNTYQTAAEFETDSFLLKFDRPLLHPRTQSWLVDLIKSKQIYFSVYTARPSLPPRGLDCNSIGYSPEAEMAAKLVGLDQIPLIAYGRLIKLGQYLNENPDSLVKPSPVQALSAIGAALSGNEWSGLVWAGNIWQKYAGKEPKEAILDINKNLQDGIEVFVFEDSPTGFLAVEKAAKILDSTGIEIKFHFMGIAKNQEKLSALKTLGAHVFEDINKALSCALISKSN